MGEACDPGVVTLFAPANTGVVVVVALGVAISRYGNRFQSERREREKENALFVVKIVG